MLTRGQSDQISAEPMLQYFQPLLLWLRVQNRNESVIGWTTNLKDEALFQPFLSGGVHKSWQFGWQKYLIIFTTLIFF